MFGGRGEKVIGIRQLEETERWLRLFRGNLELEIIGLGRTVCPCMETYLSDVGTNTNQNAVYVCVCVCGGGAGRRRGSCLLNAV